MQPRSAGPHPDQGKTGSRAGARHRRRSPRTAQHGPAWIPSFLRLTLARTAVSIPTRPEASPGLVARLRSGTPEGQGGHGGRRVCREWCPGHGPSFDIRSGDSRTFSSSVPRSSRPQFPSWNNRCLALLKWSSGGLRPHGPGHSAGGKDASLHPSFRLPNSPSLSPWAPSLSSLLSLPRQRVVLGRRLRGETLPFAGSWAGTRAVGVGPPCLAGGFSPLANPRPPVSLPLPRRRAVLDL